MTDRQPWLIGADIFLDGKRYTYRNFHSCPRVGEFIGMYDNKTDTEGVFQVYRVVHLNPSKDAEFLHRQEIDLYVNREQPTNDA